MDQDPVDHLDLLRVDRPRLVGPGPRVPHLWDRAVIPISIISPKVRVVLECRPDRPSVQDPATQCRAQWNRDME